MCILTLFDNDVLSHWFVTLFYYGIEMLHDCCVKSTKVMHMP